MRLLAFKANTLNSWDTLLAVACLSGFLSSAEGFSLMNVTILSSMLTSLTLQPKLNHISDGVCFPLIHHLSSSYADAGSLPPIASSILLKDILISLRVLPLFESSIPKPEYLLLVGAFGEILFTAHLKHIIIF